jgi:capsular exopolysaccharide synthesis family protein
MEPLDYLRLLKRRWRLLAAAVLVAGAIAWITTPANPSNRQVTYEATHVLLRDDSSPTPPPALAQVTLFVESGEVPERVAERLDSDLSAADLVRRVEVTPDEPSGSVEIVASGPSREEAAELANAFGEETLGFFGDEAQEAQADAIQEANDEVARLDAEIKAIEDDIAAAEAAGRGTGVLEAQRDARIRQYALALDQQVQVLDQPPPSSGYVSLAPASAELATPRDGGFETPRSRPVRVALAMVLGIVLGLIAILVAERLDPRIHTREGAMQAFGLPVVAEVPRTAAHRGRGPRPIALVTSPLSAAAEAYRSVRAAVLLTPVRQLGADGAPDRQDADRDDPQVILVTSPTPGEGKTTTVANLAASFAETGRSVLVLSCDFRRPEIHRHFDVPDRPGLSEVLTGDKDLGDVARTTAVNGVFIAPDGGGLRHHGDLATHGPELIARARALADVVLVDTAPALATNDASELIPEVDAVVLVCRSGGTTAESARRTRALLERLSTPVVGVVVVGVPASEGSYAGYYTTPAQQERSRIPLRRSSRSAEIEDRIEPYGATGVVGRSTEAGDGPARLGG